MATKKMTAENPVGQSDGKGGIEYVSWEEHETRLKATRAADEAALVVLEKKVVLAKEQAPSRAIDTIRVSDGPALTGIARAVAARQRQIDTEQKKTPAPTPVLRPSGTFKGTGLSRIINFGTK